MNSVIIEDITYTIPVYVKYIAQDECGEWNGFDEKPLCKMPYCFWKEQGKIEPYTICEGKPFLSETDKYENVPKQLFVIGKNNHLKRIRSI